MKHLLALFIVFILPISAFSQNGLYIGLEGNIHYGFYHADDPGGLIDINYDRYNRMQSAGGIRLGGYLSENLIIETGYIRFRTLRYSWLLSDNNRITSITTGNTSHDIPLRLIYSHKLNSYLSLQPYAGIRLLISQNYNNEAAPSPIPISNEDTLTMATSQHGPNNESFSLEAGLRLAYSGPKKRVEYSAGLFYLQGLSTFAQTNVRYFKNEAPEAISNSRIWPNASGLNLSFGIVYHIIRQKSLDDYRK
ncbi:hypothetical protein RCC89_05645 [Cytophagaceae bacterium ABcell3]|nr:hypothetical protein RCC89_05645 [Cytophagaceae bacterium ABcell3]